MEAESSVVAVDVANLGHRGSLERDSKPAPPTSIWKSAASLEDIDVDVEPVDVAVKEVPRATPGSIHIELAGGK